MFGRRLRQLRRQKGLSQAQLAEAIGVSPEFVSNMERGVNAPSFGTLERLSVALGSPAKGLFDFNDNL